MIKRQGGVIMKVKTNISPKFQETYAIICSDALNEEVEEAVAMLSHQSQPIVVLDRERQVILKPADIYMVKVEGRDVFIYTKQHRYLSRKRLYSMKEQVPDLLQISKSTLVNKAYLDCFEPGFSGSLLIKLENGLSDYVSRHYLPAFKKYLGL
jgi:DNA-binding LytR/AlgR family response regulator